MASKKKEIIIGPISFPKHGGKYSRRIGPNGESTKRPIAFKTIKDQYMGQIYKTKRGQLVEVIDFQDKFHATVRFLDEIGYTTVANIDNVRTGSVNNPYWRNSYGGYFGEGPYSGSGPVMTKINKTWSCMIRRANVHLDRRVYDNTAVCEEWLCYQNFADWYVKYMALINPKYYSALEIDKDILQWNHKFKIYSPATCCLVPHDVNVKLDGIYNSRNEGRELPIGVNHNYYGRYRAQITKNGKRICIGTYDTPEEAFEAYKNARKQDIIEMATYFYNDGAITTDVYNALSSLEILPSQEDLI